MKIRKIQEYMKNKILLILMVMFLFSCSNWATIDGDIITKVEKYGDSTCIYTTNEDQIDNLSFNKEYPRFVAKKGLYNIGDTLKYTK